MKQINTQPTEEEITTYNMYSGGYVEPIPGEFTVTRDGHIDELWHEQHDAQVRKDYLKAYAREKVREMAQTGFVIVRGIGSAAMEIMDAAAEAGKDKPLLNN